jgi:hypothetical protein
MSGDQTQQLSMVVDAYRTYQRMLEIGSRGLQLAAFTKYRMRARSFHKTYGVWPRDATTRNMGSRNKPSPEKLANLVIHQHLENA